MANEVLIKTAGGPTIISFNVTGSFSPTDSGNNWLADQAADTNAALTLAGVANAAGRQSAKVDLGATRAARYAVYGCVDYTGETPTSGGTVDYYWAPSTSGTAANSNVAGNSGADAAAPDGALGSITLAEFILMCQYIGSLVVTDDGAVQSGYVGIFSPPERYGQLVVVNNGGDAFEADNNPNNQHHQVFVPLTDEIQ
jgi:hypothetical protein